MKEYTQIKHIFKFSVCFLSNNKVENPTFCVEDILSLLLNCNRLDVYLRFEEVLNEKQLKLFFDFLNRKSKREPIEYILKEIEFFGCKLNIDKRVFIPRKETEILAEKAFLKIKKEEHKNKNLWDICCGSGCLGLSLKKKLPKLNVFVSDISDDVLSVAKKNCVTNNLEVEILKGDFLKPFENLKADYVICNPPYVSEEEYCNLDPGVVDFEPKEAVVSGNNGYEFYEKISTELPRFLNKGAKIFLEIGKDQKKNILNIFKNKIWKTVECEKDFSGKDRFFFLELE